MAFLCKADIAVIDFLGCNKTVVVADVLVVPGDLRLDIVKLLIECTASSDLPLARLVLTSHKARDISFLQLKPAWVPLMVIRPIIGVFPFFTDCLFSKHLAIHGLR